MSERLPMVWSQTAINPNILQAPPPAPRQPPIRQAYPASSWFWRNLAQTRVVPPEGMVTFRDSLLPVRPHELPTDRRLFWWWHVDRALPGIGALLVGVVLLAWLLAAVS